MEIDEYESDEEDDEYVDIDDDHTDANGDGTSTKNSGGRPLKPFSINGTTQRRAKLQKPYSALETFVKKHKDVSFPELLGRIFAIFVYIFSCLFTFTVTLCRSSWQNAFQ